MVPPEPGRLGGGLGIPVVAGHDQRTADHDLAALALREQGAVVGHDGDRDSGVGRPAEENRWTAFSPSGPKWSEGAMVEIIIGASDRPNSWATERDHDQVGGQLRSTCPGPR